MRFLQIFISYRVGEAIAADHKSLFAADDSTPFKDKKDVIDRLLPYHITQFPEQAPLEELDIKGIEESHRKQFLEVQTSILEDIEKVHQVCFFMFCSRK